MDIIQRIEQLNRQRGWSYYRLSQESGVSQSAISNLVKRDNSPTLVTLERFCRAYKISLSQFFCGCDGTDDTESAKDLQLLFDLYQRLTKSQKKETIRYIRSLLRENTQKEERKPPT